MRAPALTRAAAVGISAVCLLIALTGCAHRQQKAVMAVPGRSRAASGPSMTPPPSATPTRGPRSTMPASPAAPTGVDTEIEVYADCTSRSFEPTGIRVTCADAGWILGDLVWTSRTSTRATAIGNLVYNDCTPSCVAGHFHQVPGTRVLLTDPGRAVSGQLVWTRLQETPWPPGYETGPLHGAPFPLPIRPL